MNVYVFEETSSQSCKIWRREKVIWRSRFALKKLNKLLLGQVGECRWPLRKPMDGTHCTVYSTIYCNHVFKAWQNNPEYSFCCLSFLAKRWSVNLYENKLHWLKTHFLGHLGKLQVYDRNQNVVMLQYIGERCKKWLKYA